MPSIHNDSDSDDDLQLSSAAQDALRSFLAERDEQEQRFASLTKEGADESKVIKISDFEEDWQQSQFWYSDDTAETLALELLDGATEDMHIALVSAPSVYVKIRELKATGRVSPKLNVVLLEYDPRFEVFKDQFVMYDFAKPLRLPPAMKGKYDRVLVDPPFLSADCQTKTALTVRWMTKPWSLGANAPKVVLCTGERMRPLVEKLYQGVGLKCTTYDIKHSNQLGNEFCCYSSFESAKFKHTTEE